MTSQSRRKRRTTASGITRATRAVKAVAALALLAAPALAQPPGTLPLPPGYQVRSQPKAAPQPPVPPASPGKVMYFTKPADAPVAGTSAAQVSTPGRLPAPLPEPPYAKPPAIVVQPEIPAGYTAQPAPMQTIPGNPYRSDKKQEEVKPKDVDPKYVRLPSREQVFMVYDDAELERAIMERIRQDHRDQGKDPKDLQADTLTFPKLPVISPAGVAYQPKTVAYEPRQVLLEPGYVVHRRLHFEQKNAERIGWDFGAIHPFVSALRFYKDVLVWPASLASGCNYGFWDTSAGKCLPGSPSPLYLYPPGLTLGGYVAEAGIITGAAFLFP